MRTVRKNDRKFVCGPSHLLRADTTQDWSASGELQAKSYSVDGCIGE